MWDQRFSEPHASYGTAPNVFLEAVAGRIPEGPVLVLGAGEGRDAVHLAGLGHAVTAMDLSAVGLANAVELAASRGLSLETLVADLADFELGESRWAGIVSIWAHVPPAIRQRVHAAVPAALRPGGVFILEAFHPEQLTAPGQGGPPVRAMLFDAATVRGELEGLSMELCQDVTRVVDEGRYHQGLSVTVQVLARRP
ncbi:MAG: class I SAM-dependent methyltransferase [Alphaproteobacteria bacterium]|nr:class I SAM-dependent methyltransferase [Alphaproteobacteria bacterium]MCB9795365.1 class I SAM-dependent methyltransferase [Alphaproteobacteria bacterium]